MPEPIRHRSLGALTRPTPSALRDELMAQGVPPYDIFVSIARNYSFAIPRASVFAELMALGPILDLGAGNGYWAQQLKWGLGVDIEAIEPRSDAAFPVFPTLEGTQYDVERYTDRALMMVWPTAADDWAGAAVDLYAKAGGTTVAYIGDPSFTATADLSLPKFLREHGFKRESRTVVDSWPAPYFPRPAYFTDTLDIYRKA